MASILPTELIEKRIFVFRGQKVMVDRDLAKLYGVDTAALNQAVKRNSERFPLDFMFQLTKNEMQDWISQIVISKSASRGIRKSPQVFTEQGIAMLSSVLKSKRAISVNIQIVRAFIYLRDIAIENSDLRLRLEYMEKNYDEQFRIVFNALQQTQNGGGMDEEHEPMGFKESDK